MPCPARSITSLVPQRRAGWLPWLARLMALAALVSLAPAPALGAPDRAPLSGFGREISLTLFRPGLWIDDTISNSGESSHLFTIPKDEYVCLHLGSVDPMPPGSTILGAHSGLSLGRQDLRLYSEGSALSSGPYSFHTYWLCFDYGPALNLRIGRVFVAPSIAFGAAISMASVARPDGDGRERAWGYMPTMTFDLPVRVFLRDRWGLSLAYHTFRESLVEGAIYHFWGEKVRANLGSAHEIRAGVFLYH